MDERVENSIDKNNQSEQVQETSVPAASESSAKKYAKSMGLPLTLTQNDNDLLRVYEGLEKGEKSPFTRKLLRYGLRYCMEHNIDIFEGTTKDKTRFNPDEMFEQSASINTVPNVPVANIDLELEPQALASVPSKNKPKPDFDIDAALELQAGIDDIKL